MRTALPALAAALALPSAASAAVPFGETPPQSVPGGLSCLRATGAPGELVAWASDGARLLRATGAGLADAGVVTLGAVRDCPVAAAKPHGAGVVAAPLDGALAVAVRDPGGGWGAPVTIPLGREVGVSGLTVAVSERGDALALWREVSFSGKAGGSVVRAILRPAGGAFGAAQALGSATSQDGVASTLAAGFGADGGAVALWSLPHGSGLESQDALDAATAPPGGPFGAPQQLAASSDGTPALAVARDGRALAAISSRNVVRVAERPPGGAFGPLEPIGQSGVGPSQLAVALGDDGSAAVAWGEGTYDGLTLARRAGTGVLGPPIEVAPAHLPSGRALDVASSVTLGGQEGLPSDDTGGDLRAALEPDGGVLLTWASQRGGPVSWTAPRAALVSRDGAVATQVLGGPLADVRSLTPVVADSGAAAVAWADDADGAGRGHLALAGAPDTPQAPFPAVRIGRPERTALKSRQSLVVPVSCSAACDLRAAAGFQTASATLLRAGTARLKFGGGPEGVAPLHAARVRVTVLSGPPGARVVQTHAISPRLRRIPDPPLPRILGLSAVRAGRFVDVTWHIDRSSPDVDFSVGVGSKPGAVDAHTGYGLARTRSLNFRKRVPAGHDPRYVRVVAARETSLQPRTATARVR